MAPSLAFSSDNDTGSCIDGIVDRPVFHNGDDNRASSDTCIPLYQHGDYHDIVQHNIHGAEVAEVAEVDHSDDIREEGDQAAAQKPETLQM